MSSIDDAKDKMRDMKDNAQAKIDTTDMDDRARAEFDKMRENRTTTDEPKTDMAE